jgi:hypothetical protein
MAFHQFGKRIGKDIPETIIAGSNRLASIDHSAQVKSIRFDWLEKIKKYQEQRKLRKPVKETIIIIE